MPAVIILLPLLGCLLLAVLGRSLRLNPAYTAAAVTTASLLALLSQAPVIGTGHAIVLAMDWIPQLGFTLSLRLDGLSFLFALLITGIGLLVIVYARYYLAAGDCTAQFFGYLLLFMVGMLGLVLSENLLLLLAFWELTSLCSFLLIGFWRQRPEARTGARLSLLVTAGGGLALLAAVLLLGRVVGSFELSAVLAAGPAIRASPLYGAILALVLVGAFTKSAQLPFHFWLPAAMAAPAPVSAYLHSAALVKAGIYLLCRLFPALSGTPEWFWAVSSIGLATLLLASFVALYQHDLKSLLAYSTISHLGLIVLLLGLGTPLGAIAAVFHVINHAVFKASLFMTAGIVEHETGTLDLRRLSGLWRYMPWTGALAVVAAASMAGVPLLNGFLSKEMFFTESLLVRQLGDAWWLMPLMALAAGIFSVAYSVRLVHDIFFGGPPQDLPTQPHEPPLWMKLPVAVLVALCLLIGILPNWSISGLLQAAAGALLQAPLPAFHIALWHGFNVPLLMSAVALAAGTALYFLRRYRWQLHAHRPSPLQARLVTEAMVAAAQRGAARLWNRLEAATLQGQLLWLLLLAIAGAALGHGISPLTGTRSLLPVTLGGAIGAVLLVGAALATTWLHRQRLQAVIALGVVGLMTALAFVQFSAPDLALTQLLIETLTIVLLLLAMYFLPAESPLEQPRWGPWRDGAIAVTAGAGAAALAWSMLTLPEETIAGYYLAAAKPLGGGYNVVNVILVDFRGFDTLGEITVLGIAAVGIAAMLSGLVLPSREQDWHARPWAAERVPLLLEVIARPLLPLALLVAVYLFLRGHNAPGGGFIAALVTGAAMVIQYATHGSYWVHERIRSSFAALIGTGLLLSVMTGVGSWVVAHPFLTSTFTHVDWPLVGEFEVASAALFDLGVFVTVIGAVLLTLARLGAVRALPARQRGDG